LKRIEGIEAKSIPKLQHFPESRGRRSFLVPQTHPQTSYDYLEKYRREDSQVRR
jgi:hypothetical protein